MTRSVLRTPILLAFALIALAPVRRRRPRGRLSEWPCKILCRSGRRPDRCGGAHPRELLSARWGGKTIVIENRPAPHHSSRPRRSQNPSPTADAADGDQLAPDHPAISHSLPYRHAKDFAPVSMIAVQPVALVATSIRGVRASADVVAAPRSKPSTTPRPGRAGGRSRRPDAAPARRHPDAEFTHINYNGSAAALTERDRRRVPLMSTSGIGAPLRRDRRIEADCQRPA